MTDILLEATLGSLSSVKKMALIIIPLMIAMEFLKDLGFLDKIAKLFSPVVKIFDMQNESGFPLIIGIIIGLSYGAGFILQTAKEYNLSERDRNLIALFLICAHAVFEDTALFMAVGVSGALLLSVRLTVAALFTFLASKILKPKKDVKQTHLRKEGVIEHE